ncbi:MAG: hypothetical protein R2852_07225 [Bacteroidia bacterium]
MYNRHQEFLMMCHQVKRLYRLNSDEFDKYPQIPTLLIKLRKMIDIYAIEFEQSITYQNSYPIERARKREDLLQNCLLFANTYKQIHETLKYKPIKQLDSLVFHDLKDLNRLDETGLIKYASVLFQLCGKLESRLRSHGVYQKAITTFANSITLFALDYPMNQLSIANRHEHLLKTEELMVKIEDFLTNQLDVCIQKELVKDSHDMFLKYTQARELKAFDLSTKPDLYGELKGDGIKVLGEYMYDRDRDFRVSIEGGTVIWGLSSNQLEIQYSRPLNPNDHISVCSRIIGSEGDYLMIQNVDPKKTIKYKVWVTES